MGRAKFTHIGADRDIFTHISYHGPPQADFFGVIVMFYMDFYDIFVRGDVFNTILKDLYSKIRYKFRLLLRAALKR